MPNKISLPIGHGQFIEVPADRILCNDIMLPGDETYRAVHHAGTHLWICETMLGNFPLVMGAVWADNEQEALDTLVNEDLAKAILLDEKDVPQDPDAEDEEGIIRLGNAGEPCDGTNLGCDRVEFDPARDWKLLCMFAEARGKGCTTLDDL